MILSEATNDIYIGVFGSHEEIISNGLFMTRSVPMAYDDRLELCPFCRTGMVKILFPAEKSIFINFKMTDSMGRIVPKTHEGLVWGSDVEHFPAAPSMKAHDRMGTMEVPGPHSLGVSALQSPRLPSPDELFVMKSRGIYSLTLEVHLMKQRTVSNGWTWDHIAIPPVTIKVEKP
jgi:hypothetical protein